MTFTLLTTPAPTRKIRIWFMDNTYLEFDAPDGGKGFIELMQAFKSAGHLLTPMAYVPWDRVKFVGLTDAYGNPATPLQGVPTSPAPTASPPSGSDPAPTPPLTS